MQSYSSAVSIDVPITLRSLRKVRSIAIRNVSFDADKIERVRSEVDIYVEGKRVFHVNTDLFELRNGTFSICEGRIDISAAEFVLKGFLSDHEVFSFDINLEKEFIDVGTSLEAFPLPTNSPYVFLKLSNGIWTSNHTSLSPHIPYITPIVSHIEPRSLSYSWILDSARVVKRLLEARKAVEADLAACQAQIFERHELTMKKLRRKIVLARKTYEEKTHNLDRLEQTVAESESMLFHKRNAYEARLRALTATRESRPPKEAPLSTLALLEEGKRRLIDRKLLKLKEVISVEKRENTFAICRFPYSKWNSDIRDEELASAALGMTVLMILNVSFILGLHFRPRLFFRGSRSFLEDTLTETELPLYYKGVEKTSYVRGVELLLDAVCELLIISRRGKGRSSELLADIYRLLDCVEDIW